jgi:hypothetical protein
MNVSLANRDAPSISIHHVKDMFLETQAPGEDRYTCATIRVRCSQSGDGYYAELSLFSENVEDQLACLEQFRDELTANIEEHRSHLIA